MSSGDPFGWNAQQQRIIQFQQQAQQQREEMMRAGGAVAAARQAQTGGYGAIAYAILLHRWGYSWGQPDQATAERVAIGYCHPEAVVACWGNNFCLALALGDRGAYGAGWGRRPKDAKKLALQNIGSWARNPHVEFCFETRTGRRR